MLAVNKTIVVPCTSCDDNETKHMRRLFNANPKLHNQFDLECCDGWVTLRTPFIGVADDDEMSMIIFLPIKVEETDEVLISHWHVALLALMYKLEDLDVKHFVIYMPSAQEDGSKWPGMTPDYAQKILRRLYETAAMFPEISYEVR